MIGEVAVRRFPALTVSTPRTEVRQLTAAHAATEVDQEVRVGDANLLID